MNNDYTNIEASKPENRSLNRYRDVYPYDHSRVVLQDCVDTDYINASLVQVLKKLNMKSSFTNFFGILYTRCQSLIYENGF